METRSFSRSSLAETLVELARAEPTRALIRVEGDAAALVDIVELWLGSERILGVRAGTEPEQALVRLFLAERGWMEVSPAEQTPVAPSEGLPRVDEAVEEATAEANRLLGVIEGLGGLGARLELSGQGTWTETPAPDGRQLVTLLKRAPSEGEILSALRDGLASGVVQHVPNRPPPPPAPSVAPPPVEATPSPSTGPQAPARPEDTFFPDLEPSKDPNEVYKIAGIIMAGIVVVLLAILFRPKSAPAPAPPLVPEPARATAPPPAPEPEAPREIEPVAVEASADGGRYSLSRPPPIVGPDADERLREAEALIARGKYGAAAKLLARLRHEIPADQTVWVLSGLLELERSRFSRSHRHLDRALKLDPENYRAWVLKGSVYQFQNRRRSAVKAYEQALTLGPNHAMSKELRLVVDRLNRRRR